MAKYRLLTLEELRALEKEFVEFLIVNGIDAEGWIKLKEQDQDSAEHILDLFSDVVFESIMRKTEFLEWRGEKEVKAFQCLADRIVLVGISAEADNDADFTNPDYIASAALNPPDTLKVYTSEKKYKEQREVELFHMTEAGCTISDGKLFKALCLSLK